MLDEHRQFALSISVRHLYQISLMFSPLEVVSVRTEWPFAQATGNFKDSRRLSRFEGSDSWRSNWPTNYSDK